MTTTKKHPINYIWKFSPNHIFFLTGKILLRPKPLQNVKRRQKEQYRDICDTKMNIYIKKKSVHTSKASILIHMLSSNKKNGPMKNQLTLILDHPQRTTEDQKEMEQSTV